MVVVRGGGVDETATTGPSGTVSIKVFPTRRGTLQITVPNLTVCPRRLATAPKHPGKQLTG
jgi:hypothetical protein